MFKVGCALVIKRPPPEVFEFVSNPENDRLWVAFARKAWKVSPGPIGAGTKFRQMGTVMGLQIWSVWEITEFERHRKMKVQTLSGPVSFKGEYALEAVSEGTRVRKAGQIGLSGWLTVVEPVLAGVFQSALEGDMNRLKKLLESGRTARQPQESHLV